MAEARIRTGELFDLVKPDSLYERPIPERHRIIFYLGHLEAFDWNLLQGRVLDLKTVSAEFDRLFAFGIDPVGGGLPSDQPQDWPTVAEVRNYASRIRQALDRGLASTIYTDSNSDREPEFSANLLLNVAIEHRLMHAETLTYMLHQLPFERKVRQPQKPELVVPPAPPGMVEVPAGSATLGLSRDDAEEFGWDNEYEKTTVKVPAFEIDRHKVTNGQFLEFIAAGGYESRTLWTDPDWSWRTADSIDHPVFWKPVG
jgi:hypothetical protein